MRDQDLRMIDAQAAHITRLNNQVRDHDREKEKIALYYESEIARIKPAHDYYMAIQKLCLENDTIMSAWQRFLTMMTLCVGEDIPPIFKKIDEEQEHQLSFPFDYVEDFDEDDDKDY